MMVRYNGHLMCITPKEISIVGRSNAINIAERLGLPSVVVDTSRKLYGSASAEIDEVYVL